MQALRAKEGRREGRKARSAPRRCERAAHRTLRLSMRTGGGEMLGLATPATGASAALPPLARRLVRPPHRRSAGRPRLVASTPAFRGETRPGPGSIIGCPNAAQRQGSAKRSLHPPSRLNRGSLCAGRAAAARAHASSHEPLRGGQHKRQRRRDNIISRRDRRHLRWRGGPAQATEAADLRPRGHRRRRREPVGIRGRAPRPVHQTGDELRRAD